MSNTKEINPKTGKRVAELIKELNMTQTEFGDKIGLGSRQISCIVTGKRRLTEDNARRIAELFPPVRYEWLLGWDDFKTSDELKIKAIQAEADDIMINTKDDNKRLYQVLGVLQEMGYILNPVFPFFSPLIDEFYEKYLFMVNHKQYFEYFFTEEEIINAFKRKKQSVSNETGEDFLSSDASLSDESICEDPEKYLDETVEIARRGNERREFLRNENVRRFKITRNNNDTILLSYQEREKFIDQIYNNLHLLVDGTFENFEKMFLKQWFSWLPLTEQMKREEQIGIRLDKYRKVKFEQRNINRKPRKLRKIMKKETTDAQEN